MIAQHLFAESFLLIDRKGILVEKDPALFLPFEIRFSGRERKQPGGMYCVRTVGAASALRARLLRSYVPLRRDRVKTCALTIHISRRTLSHSDKSGIFTYFINIASPKLKNRYLSRTASSYAASTCSFPASADTSMMSVDSGRWKFVIRQSRALNRYPG